MASPIHVAAIMATLHKKLRCPACGQPRPARARFCPACGQPTHRQKAPDRPLLKKPDTGLLAWLRNLWR